MNARILVVDDNPAIHEDFRKIFGTSQPRGPLSEAEAALFGAEDVQAAAPQFHIDDAFQGQDGLTRVRTALEQQQPYALAFIDVRMPPGWDGIETTAQIWQLDPDIQVVICTAYSDYSWSETLARLGHSDRLVILKKPFDTIEVLQLATALTEKWRLGQQSRSMLAQLEGRVAERTRELVVAGERLRQSESQYRLLFDSNPHPMWVYDVETLRFVMVNDAAVQHYGYSKQQFLEMSIRDIRPPEDVDAVEKAAIDLLGGGKSSGLWRHRKQDGTDIDMEISSDQIVFDGRPSRLVLAHDVTERRQVAARIQESEERFRDLAANIDEVFWLTDADKSRMLYVSPAYERIWGRSCASLYASPQNWLEAIYPDDRERVLQAMPGQVLGDYNEEYRITRPDGEMRWVRDRAFPIRDAGGRVHRIGGVAQDITERKHDELELSRINRALKMLGACNEALIRTTVEQQLLDAICRIAVEIGGYRMAWIGYAQHDPARSIAPMAHAGEERGYLQGLQVSWSEATASGRGPAGRAIRDGEIVVIEDLALDAGFAPWREAALERGYRGVVCLPLLGAERTLGALVLFTAGVARISTDEIELLQEMADNMAFGITSIRAGIETRQMQGAVLKIAQGVSAGSGEEFFDLLTRSLVEAVQADGGTVGRLAADSSRPTVHCVSLEMDGSKRDNISYALAGTPCEQVVSADLCVFERDIQRRFPFDRMLADFSLEAYAGIPLRDAHGGTLGLLAVFFRTPITRPALVESALRIFAARAASEMERQRVDASVVEQASLLDQAHDAIVVRGIDDRVRFWNKGAERLFGWTAAEAIGHTLEQLLCHDTDCLHAAVGGVMISGAWSGNLEHRRKDGSRLTVAAQWTLVRDGRGRPKSILCISADITKRLALEHQLQQSQRLEAVGQLTGGVAHDFNNLLTVILGNSELLAERLVDNRRLHQLAEMIRNAAQRGADLTNRLLAFSRRQALEPRAVDVNQLLAGMEGLLHRTLRADIALTRVAGADLWQALVDPAQLEGAVLNLCINARDAMPAGGRLTVETGNTIFDDEGDRQNPEVKPGRYVMVAVSDTGQGIAPENLKRVFEPFFTTKEFGKGTGLGLSMVYGFVRQSQGHVNLYSEVGRGTTVKMFLPWVDRPADVLVDAARAGPELRGSEKVLLAEDDEMVRRYAEEQLVELGYRVVAVRNGEEALEAIRLQDDFDLLFTDVIMPGGINGSELAQAARKLRPALKVLFTSGYTDNAIEQQGSFRPAVHLLSKPYRRIELAQKVRAALAQAPP